MTIAKAKKVLRIEAQALLDLARRVDKNFVRALDLIMKSKGRVIVTGVGKARIIGEKISATLASTGTPSLSLHAADALHGDLGRVTKEDVVLVLSNSGESDELTKLLPLVKKIGAALVAMTGSKKSTLARNADCVLDVSVKKEACPLGLAPTASTTAMLGMGDALAVALLERKHFKPEDFAFYHPAGTLGRRLLLKVEDIMRTGRANPVVRENALVKDVLLKITEARAGSANVINKEGKLTGIFTDGDLRRHLKEGGDITQKKVRDVMTKNPTTLKAGHLAAEAFGILRSKKIDEVPIVDDKIRPVGLLDVQDILKAGLV